jgi:hypothetical protein
MKNITFSFLAFHLQQRLDDAPDVPNPKADSLWKSLTFLPFPELENIKSQSEGEVKLTAIPTHSGFKLEGNLQGFLLNDTYCVDITLKPEGENVEVEVAQLSAF